MLTFFSYQDIRYLNLILQFFLSFALAYFLKKKIGTGAAAAWIITWIVLNPVTVSMCMEQAIMIYISIIASIVMLSSRIDGNKLYLFFLFVGVATAYFDFLTYPLLGLGLPLTICIWMNFRDLKDRIRGLFSFSFYWLLGYFGMWSMKWLLCGLFTDFNAVYDAAVKIRERSFGYEEGYSLVYTDVLMKQIGILKKRPVFLFLLFMFLFGLFCYLKQRRKADIGELVICLCIAIMPPVWYFVLRNHSAIHYFFTYRTLGVSLFSVYTFLLSPINERQDNGISV